MSGIRHADELLWLIDEFEQPLCGIHRDNIVFVSMHNKNRNMNIPNCKVRTKLVEHQPAYWQHPKLRSSNVGSRQKRRVEHEGGCLMSGSEGRRDTCP